MALAFSTIHPPPSNALRLDFLRFSPQPLKAVEFAGFMIEDMGDHRTKIKKHPLPFGQALDVEGGHLDLFHLVHKMHRNGLHMPVAIPVTDQKIMRDAGMFGDIKKHRVFDLLVFRKRS